MTVGEVNRQTVGFCLTFAIECQYVFGSLLLWRLMFSISVGKSVDSSGDVVASACPFV